MSRKTLLVQRGNGTSGQMSYQGIKDLWVDIFEADPEIMGLVIELDDDYELPTGYKVTNIEDASLE